MRKRTIVAVILGVALLGSAPAVRASSSDEKAIKKAFSDVLQREPSDREMRRYRDLMENEHWTERDVRNDLRDRSDYRHHSSDPDRVVRRAYQDVLDREPDTDGLRLYRSRMIDQGWTEQDVREALRKSPEYAQHSGQSAERIVRRAYQDILGRDPDPNGLATYRRKIVDQGWEEQDVRQALRKSPEYHQKGSTSSASSTHSTSRATTRAEAEEIVRRAYQSVLGRDPDSGSQGYVERVMRERWTEADVARELRKSAEYRQKHQR